MIIPPILTTSLHTFLFQRLGECTFLSLGVKGLIDCFCTPFKIWCRSLQRAAGSPNISSSHQIFDQDMCRENIMKRPAQLQVWLSNLSSGYHLQQRRSICRRINPWRSHCGNTPTCTSRRSCYRCRAQFLFGCGKRGNQNFLYQTPDSILGLVCGKKEFLNSCQ